MEKTTTVQDWDEVEERRLVRKLDLRVLLPCCIIYFLAYLDRANLGNVKILQKGTLLSKFTIICSKLIRERDS